MRLKNKIALITGGARGIGLGFAQACLHAADLAARGA